MHRDTRTSIPLMVLLQYSRDALSVFAAAAAAAVAVAVVVVAAAAAAEESSLWKLEPETS